MGCYTYALFHYLSNTYHCSEYIHGFDALKMTEFLFSKEGVSINGKYFEGHTALHLATKDGDEFIVNYLLGKSADPNLKDIRGNTSLHIAITNNDIPLAKLLLDNGALLEATCANALTGFLLAIHLGNNSMIELLLNYKESQPSIFKTIILLGETVGPLEYAVNLLNIEIVKLLLKAENVQFLKESKENIVFHIMHSCKMEYCPPDRKAKYIDIIKLFFQSGININATDGGDNTLLQWVLFIKNEQLTEFLIERGCKLDAPNENSESSLMTVVGICTECKSKKEFLKWKNIFELHFKYGGDYIMHNKWTLVVYKSLFMMKFPFIFELLCIFWKYGYPYDYKELYNERNLHFHQIEDVNKIIGYQKLLFDGIKHNDKKSVEKAIKLGAVVRGTSMDIRFPLHFVASNGFTDVASILLQHGILVNKLNDKEQTALQLAISHRYIDMCKILFQHGACLDYEVEIMKLKDDDKIKMLLQTVHSQFELAKKGDEAIIDILDNLLETDLEMFLVVTCASDKHKRSIMATAMHYKHDVIVKKIMELRMKYKISTIKL